MNNNSNILDVDELSFPQDVIERSKRQPVVVDFWAPWCGPCRTLSPTLERIAGEANGAFTLVKINTDENQRLAAEYGVQGIPAVKMFRDGRVVGEFVGALPEPRVREFIKKYAPNQSDLIVTAAQELAKEGRWAEAEAAYRHALAVEPENAQVMLELAKVLLQSGDTASAATLLQAIPGDTREASAASTLLPLVHWMGTSPENAAGDLDRLYASAARSAHERKYAEAMDTLLDLLRQNRNYRNGEAKPIMLALFDLLGDNPLVNEYRRKLANVLF